MNSPFISQAMINIPDPSPYEWCKKKAYRSGIFYHRHARFEFSILLTRVGELYTMLSTIASINHNEEKTLRVHHRNRFERVRIIKLAMLLFCLTISANALSQSQESKAIAIHMGEEGPGGCELLGRVKGSSKENDQDANEDKTPYVDRLVKARNRLREETAKLGGNTVHILRANNSGKYEVPGADKEIFYIGDAYRCN